MHREGFCLPIRRNLARVIAALALAVGCFVVAPSALALHARPNSATPTSFRMVPAFEECFGSTTSTHGSPLTLPSCNPVIQSSSYLTMNANERMAPYLGPANGNALVILKTTCVSSISPPVENGDTPPCNANVGDQQDVKITLAVNDVRCVGNPGPPAQSLCAGGAGSAGAGTQYSGKVLVDIPMRITDHFNALSPNPAPTECSDTTTCTATAADTVLSIGSQCTNGGCSYTTSADAVIPGLVREKDRAVVELGQVQFQDAGADGDLAAAQAPASGVCPPACEQDDLATVFLTQGIFAP
jgi:hypothetical protein